MSNKPMIIATEYKNHRLEQVTPLLQQARDACKRLGGLAQIDERYSIVDTELYEVNERKNK